MRVPANAPIVAVDIDGTLAGYYDHFKNFAEMYLQRPLSVHWSRAYRGEFSEALGLDKEVYRQIKLAYRQGGLKRSLPVEDGAGDFVRGLRKRGVAVWICTTRPWNRLDNIDPDTRFWLETFIGRVDGVIFGEEKFQDLLDIVGDRKVICAIDDLPENIEKAEGLGIPAFIKEGKHNAWYTEVNPNVRILRNFHYNETKRIMTLVDNALKESK